MALYDKSFKKSVNKSINPYGDGKSAKKIVDVLETIDIEPSLIQKRITYEL